jgi:cbb3-type cytochrome oxidase subunit 1
MRGVAFWFFASGVVYVTLGMLFGIWMSASQDHTMAGAHAHLNLVGWVTMALFGVYYHLVPAAASSRLARIHFALATLGVWFMVPGIALAIEGRTEIPVIIGSFATALSMLTFLFVVFRTRTALATA